MFLHGQITIGAICVRSPRPQSLLLWPMCTPIATFQLAGSFTVTIAHRCKKPLLLRSPLHTRTTLDAGAGFTGRRFRPMGGPSQSKYIHFHMLYQNNLVMHLRHEMHLCLHTHTHIPSHAHITHMHNHA